MNTLVMKICSSSGLSTYPDPSKANGHSNTNLIGKEQSSSPWSSRAEYSTSAKPRDCSKKKQVQMQATGSETGGGNTRPTPSTRVLKSVGNK